MVSRTTDNNQTAPPFPASAFAYACVPCFATYSSHSSSFPFTAGWILRIPYRVQTHHDNRSMSNLHSDHMCIAYPPFRHTQNNPQSSPCHPPRAHRRISRQAFPPSEHRRPHLPERCFRHADRTPLPGVGDNHIADRHNARPSSRLPTRRTNSIPRSHSLPSPFTAGSGLHMGSVTGMSGARFRKSAHPGE